MAFNMTVMRQKRVKYPQKPFLLRVKKDFLKYKYVYLMLLPVVVWYIIFAYWPLMGNIIAFKNFKPVAGIWNSPWVGFAHFKSFFSSYYFTRLLINTTLISVYGIIFAFPAPILLAIMINEVRFKRYKRVVQTITYMPYFISMVVFCGIIIDFMKKDGVLTSALTIFGMPNENHLMKPDAFRTIFVGSGIWQNMGWNSIIFLAALAGIDQELFEAARIDGANRLKQIWHITLPGILPVIMILLIMRMGQLLNVGFEKVILLKNNANAVNAEVISSFVYQRGILEANYSYSTAVGLFNSIISFILVIGSNKISRSTTEYGLW